MVKNLPAMHSPGFDPQVGKIPWSREWQSTLVFLPGEFHGERSHGIPYAKLQSMGHKELDMTEQTTLSHFLSFISCVTLAIFASVK